MDQSRSIIHSTRFMTKDIYISMLRQGNNGSQIIEILETITNDLDSQESQEPTLDPIDF